MVDASDHEIIVHALDLHLIYCLFCDTLNIALLAVVVVVHLFLGVRGLIVLELLSLDR